MNDQDRRRALRGIDPVTLAESCGFDKLFSALLACPGAYLTARKIGGPTYGRVPLQPGDRVVIYEISCVGPPEPQE